MSRQDLHQRSLTPAAGAATSYAIGRRVVSVDPGDALTESGWVYACVSANASTIAQVPWKVQEKKGGEWVDVEGDAHELAQLIEEPNEIWSWEDIVEHNSMALDLAGNSINTLIRRQTGDKSPLEIWWMNPERFTPRGSEERLISHYDYYDPRGRRREIASEDVVHVMLPTWDDPRWGIAPLEAAKKQVSIDTSGNEAIEALSGNSFAPSVHVHFPGAGPDEVQKWTSVIADEYMTTAAAGRPFVTGGPATEVKALTMTPKDSRLVERKQLSRTEIVAIFGVPEPVVGILDKANYNNMRAAIRLWWDRALLPRLSRIQRFFDRQLVRPNWGRDVRLVYDADAIPALIGQLAEKLEAGLNLYEIGYSRDEINERLGIGMPTTSDASDAEVIDLDERRRRRSRRKHGSAA